MGLSVNDFDGTFPSPPCEIPRMDSVPLEAHTLGVVWVVHTATKFRQDSGARSSAMVHPLELHVTCQNGSPAMVQSTWPCSERENMVAV